MKYLSKLLLVVMMAGLLLLSPWTGVQANAADSQRQGEIVKVTGDIYVNDGTTVDGDVVAMKGNIYIDGTVTGDAVAVFGDIIVNGKILGDAIAVTGRITVGEKGRILGDTVEALGGSLGSGGKYNYKYDYDYNYTPGVRLSPWSRTTNVLLSFLTTLAFFLLASLVYVIMPRKIEEMADSTELKLGKRLGIGILTVIGSPIAMVILTIVLAITIIGIILIPFIWIAYLIAGLVALVPAYVYIGGKVAEIVSKQKIKSYGALAAGIFTLWIIKTILSLGGFYTEWIYWIVSLVVFCLGVGTLIDYVVTNRKKKKEHAQYPPYPPYPPQGEGQGYLSGNYIPGHVPVNGENEEQEGNTPKDDNK